MISKEEFEKRNAINNTTGKPVAWKMVQGI